MIPYIPLLFFVAGGIVDVLIICVGLYIGFRASYDIRNHREGWQNNDGNIKLKSGDPAEFELDELDNELDREVK